MPGFGLTMGVTVFFLTTMVLIPICRAHYSRVRSFMG